MFGFYINQTMVPHAAVIFYFSFRKDELITLGCSDYNLPLSSAFYHLYLKVAVQCYNYMWYHCFLFFFSCSGCRLSVCGQVGLIGCSTGNGLFKEAEFAEGRAGSG